MSLDNILLIPGVGEGYPISRYEGAWAVKQPWLDGSTVLDQRTGLGTPRPPEPRRCLELNGTDQYGTANQFTLDGDFTISFYVNTSTVPCNIIGGSNNDYVRFANVSAIICRINSVNQTVWLSGQEGATAIQFGTWYHFVIIRENGFIRVFKDGVLEATNREAPGTFYLGLFGAYGGGIVSGNAKLLDIRVHDGIAATEAQVQQLMQGDSIGNEVWALSCDQNSTTVMYDSSASQNHVTLVNGAAGMLYEGRDVPFSRQNEVGFSERRNQSQNSEPSVSELTVVSGPPTDAAGFGQFSSSLQFPAGASFVYAYMRGSEAWVQGVTGTISVFVKMDDGLAPIFGSATVSSSLNDFVLNLRNSVMSPLLYVVEHVGDGVYRVSCTETTGNNVSNNGVVRYAGNSGRGFRVTGYQYDVAAGSSEYQRIVSEPGINVRIPALLSDPTKSAATDPLTYTGKAHFDGTLEQSNCLTFDGVDDHVLGDALPEMSINLDWSGHFRLKVDSSGSFVVLNNIINTNDRVAISTTGASLRFGLWNGTTWVTRNGIVVIGQWHLIEFSYQGGILTATIDGVPLDTSLTPISTSIGGFSLGARPQGDFLFNGSICDFQVDGVIHLPMSEGAGDFVHDTIGNQAYPIVNGQASNWETKQDVYNYNITKGATKIDTSVSENFDPSTLVLSSETSIGIDPSDFTHLFQDHRGTIPVTQVGDPIGLVIDKQQGGLNNLGPELVTNGSFSTTDNWTLAEGSGGSAVISGGLLTLSGPNTSFPSATQSGILTANRWYKVTVVTTSNITAGSLGIRIGGVATQYTGFSTAGTYNLTILSDGSDLRLIRNSGYVDTPIIDNVSVREIPGYHLSQADNAKRPILARTPEGGGRQLLQWSEDLNNAAWLKSRISVTGGVEDPLGGNTAWQLTATDATALVRQLPSVIGGSVVHSVWLRRRTGTGPIVIYRGGGTTTTTVTLTDTWQKFTAESTTMSGSNDSVGVVISSSGDEIDFWHPQFESGTTDTAYQKATTLFDITEDGKRDCWAIGFPGNAALSTPASVDMTGSDEMVVCAGVRKLSDAATGTLIESSSNVASFNGAFLLRAPWVVAPGYGWASNGTSLTQATVGANYVAPVSNVLTGIGDISGDIARLRINGVQVAESLDDQGAGNYGNHRIYIGARAESSLYFNGLMYSCVIINRLLTDFERERLENWSAYKQGAANFHIIEPLFVPASQTNLGFDSLGNPLTHPAIVGHNGAETEINYSPVDNSWPEQYSIPGADLPNYTFDGDPGDIVLGIDTATREARFKLER